jgi:hypothetical protein
MSHLHKLIVKTDSSTISETKHEGGRVDSNDVLIMYSYYNFLENT